MKWKSHDSTTGDELVPLEKQAESVFRFADNLNSLLVEAKKKQTAKTKPPKVLKKKDGKPDNRSPVIKSILKNKYEKTGGLHPRDARIMKQVQELNGKPSYDIKPLTHTRIAGKSNLIRESTETLEIVKSVLNEYSTKATQTSHWNRSRHGKVRGLQPGNRPERAIVKTVKHEDKSAKNLAREKFERARNKMEYDQAQSRRDAHISQVAKIT